MSGQSPYSAHSPAQPSNRHLYSPKNKTTSAYDHDPYHHDPRSPPSFQQHPSLTRSPHTKPPLPLPGMNGPGSAHLNGSPHYQHKNLPAFSEYSTANNQSGTMDASIYQSSYASSPPSHAHPHNPRESIPLSPRRPNENGEIFRPSSNGDYSAQATTSALGPASRPPSQGVCPSLQLPTRTNSCTETC